MTLLLLLTSSGGGGGGVTQYAQLQTITGQTGLVMTILAQNGDTVLYTSDSVTEKTNAKTKYVGTFGESSVIPAGTYFVLLSTSGGVPLASGERVFTGTDGETAKETFSDGESYLLAINGGAVSNPQATQSSYAITVGGVTHTVVINGQDSTGVRTEPTFSKA